MSLTEWEEKNGVRCRDFHKPGYDQFKVIADGSFNGTRSELWRLTDYRVTSVTGGAIWLQRIL